MKQLDLFDSKKAPKQAATVYRFPLARRADLVRAISADLHARNVAAGRRHWNAHVKAIRRELRAAGLSSTDIDSEIRDYALAVRIKVLSSLPKSASR